MFEKLKEIKEKVVSKLMSFLDDLNIKVENIDNIVIKSSARVLFNIFANPLIGILNIDFLFYTDEDGKLHIVFDEIKAAFGQFVNFTLLTILSFALFHSPLPVFVYIAVSIYETFKFYEPTKSI